MKLKNNSARLLTVNHNGSKYRILPGNNPAVDVPNDACKSDFVKNLLKIGDLVKVSDPAKSPGRPAKPTEPDSKDQE